MPAPLPTVSTSEKKESPCTCAGNGEAGFVDGDGSSARFNSPCGIAVDGDGNFIVTDLPNHAIRKVTPEGIVTTLAGNGEAGFVDGDGNSARFNSPSGIDVDGDGNFVVADADNHAIRKVTPEGLVTTLAGNGEAGFVDGDGSSARFNGPSGIAVDGYGNCIATDADNHAIRKVTPEGLVTTLVGNGEAGFVDGDGSSARFKSPCGIAVDGDGNFMVTDFRNHAIRKVTPEGLVTLAGNGEAGFVDGDGNSARFNAPFGIAADGDGNFMVTDFRNHAIRKVTPLGSVTTQVATGFASACLTIDLCGNIIAGKVHGMVKLFSAQVPSARRPTFIANMYEMMNDTEDADVVFVVGQDHVEITSHGVLLKHRSEYFRKMLNSRFREGNPNGRICHPQANPRAFRARLTHLYTGKLDVEEDIVVEVAQLADQFIIRDLTEQCFGYCRLRIHVGNVALWLAQSDKYGLAILRKTCLDYICSHLNEIKSKMPQTLKYLNATLLQEVVMKSSVV